MNSEIQIGNTLIAMSDIEKVAFFKRDEITTDLICCEIFYKNNEGDMSRIILHEEKEYFDKTVLALSGLPGFMNHWREVVVKPAFVENYTIVFLRKP